MHGRPAPGWKPSPQKPSATARSRRGRCLTCPAEQSSAVVMVKARPGSVIAQASCDENWRASRARPDEDVWAYASNDAKGRGRGRPRHTCKEKKKKGRPEPPSG